MLDKGTCNVATIKSDTGNGQTTTAFYTNSNDGNSGSRFRWKCNKCGKPGHKARDCTTDKKDYVKFTGKCGWCGKTGHRERHCFAKRRGEPRTNTNGGNNYGGSSANNVQNSTTDSVDDMFAGMTYCQFISETNTVEPTTDSWLGDSGATSHITNNSDGMTNKKECSVRVTVSTGEVTIAKLVGDLKLESKSGEKVKLLNVLYVPSLKRNLLSTNRFTDRGAKLYADNEKW